MSAMNTIAASFPADDLEFPSVYPRRGQVKWQEMVFSEEFTLQSQLATTLAPLYSTRFAEQPSDIP